MAISATQDAAVRHFTRVFKSILRLGVDAELYITDTWTVVRGAAHAELARTKQPGLAAAISIIDNLVSIVAKLPKPDMNADDDDKQTDLPVDGAKPVTDAKPADAGKAA